MRENVTHALTNDLRRKPWKDAAHPLAGHCYVASEALVHLEPGRYASWVVHHEGANHWYLTDRVTGAIVDLTAGQFETAVPYHCGRRCGFLTKQPSKRASIVIERVISCRINIVEQKGGTP